MLIDKIKEIKEKWKKEGIENEKLSKEDTYNINKRINDEMSVVRRDYKKREAESIESASRTYITC